LQTAAPILDDIFQSRIQTGSFAQNYSRGDTKRPRSIRELFSRSHGAVIRVYDDAGNVIETHEHKGDFKE